MRSELHESNLNPSIDRGTLGVDARRWASRAGSGRRSALEPLAVDAALDDDATAPAQRGSRRDLVAASGVDRAKRIVDEPHVTATASAGDGRPDDGLLQSLADQLRMLQLQQEQITRLLEQAERCAGGAR